MSPSGRFRSILLDRPADAGELKDPLVLLRPDLDPVFSAAGADQDGYDLALVGERALGRLTPTGSALTAARTRLVPHGGHRDAVDRRRPGAQAFSFRSGK